MGIEIGIRRRCAFIVQYFRHHGFQVAFVLRSHPGKDNIGQLIAVHIGVNVIGSAVVVVSRGDDGASAGAVISHQQDGSRRDCPVVVCVIHILLDGGGCVSAHFGRGHDFCQNALFGTENPKRVSPCRKGGIIGGDDQIIASFVVPFIVWESSCFRQCGNGCLVDHHIAEDGFPPAVAQAVFSKMAVTAFKLNIQFHIAVNNEFFGHRIILKRTDGNDHHIHTPDFHRVRHHHEILRIVSVF